MFISEGEERAYHAAQSTDREWETKLSVLVQQWEARASVAHATDSLTGDREERVYLRCARELQEMLNGR